MGPIPSRHVPLLLMGVGALLLLNPLYAFSGGVAPTNLYGVGEIGEAGEIDGDDEDVHLALQRAENVHVCPGERTCLAEERIAEEGTIEADSGAFDGQRGYDVVRIDGRYYRPTVESTGDGGYRFGHEELTLEEALEAAALSSDEAGPEVRSAIRWGVVGSDASVPVLEERIVVEHDGTYYQRQTLSRSPTGVPFYHAIAARLVGFTLGGALLVVGYRRYERLVDAGVDDRSS